MTANPQRPPDSQPINNVSINGATSGKPTLWLSVVGADRTQNSLAVIWYVKAHWSLSAT